MDAGRMIFFQGGGCILDGHSSGHVTRVFHLHTRQSCLFGWIVQHTLDIFCSDIMEVTSGNSETVNLPTGDLLRRELRDKDLSGTFISAANDRKIAVFAGTP